MSIIGHTDSTGSEQINQPLPLDRASHTCAYLAHRGAAANRITVEGRAAREPVAFT